MTQNPTARDVSSQVVVLGLGRLTLSDLVAVARHGARVELDDGVAERLRASQEWVAAAGLERPIYSINTGFGSLAGRQAFADPADAAELSRRLVLSNASGIGRYVDAELVRATMLIRAVSLLSGHSGVRPEVARLVVDMLNAGVHPAIPEYGSLGASGDLIPLAHLALVMTKGIDGRESAEEDVRNSGEVLADGGVVPGAEAMAAAGLERIALAAKEGLALLNGTSFSCAQVALALHDAQNLLATNLVTAAMSIEALKGFGDAFIAELHEARGQAGQIEVAARIRELLTGATLTAGDRDHDTVQQPPQDAY